MANRGTRTFGYGFTGVLLGIYLSLLGGDDAAVVASLGIALLSGGVLNVVVGHYADVFGRRRTMILFGLLMTAAGVLLAFAPSFPVAVLALAMGVVTPTGTEVGPFLSLEQSIVADVARTGRRTRAFAVYNLTGSLAASAGALASGIPTLVLGAPPTTPEALRPMFLLFAGLGVVAATLGGSLPPEVEIRGPSTRVALSAQARSRVARMSVLFGVDSFAGGFVIQGFVAFWFYVTYPESRALLGPLFFVAGIVTAASFVVAARLGERFGLLRTMVITHLMSNVFLILVPLAPSFPAALGLYLGRMALSQMDVPTRQAYLAGIVAREERTAANAATNTVRNFAQAGGPLSVGALLNAVGLSAPFLLGGALKILYDVSVFATFRGVEPAVV
ncbi:MAG: MFS transporter [Methanobacteriota archaeon]